MLVALHGFTETDLAWYEALAELGQAVYCPLIPGHGHKPYPPGLTLGAYADELAQDLKQRFPTGIHLLGYSLGGRIATQLALNHPELVTKLTLVSCRPGVANAADRAARLKRDESLAQILEEDGIGAFVSWWERQQVLRPARQLSVHIAERTRCFRLNQDPIGLAGALRGLGQASMNNLWPRLHELTMPVHLILGEADTSFVADMQAMHQAIPQSKLTIVPATGHAIHREYPAALIKALSS